MAENSNDQIKKEVTRIDTLDSIEDSQVTLNPEKIDEYTETYINKVGELVANLDESDLSKAQKEAIKKDLIAKLSLVIGQEELEEFASEFGEKIDSYLKIVAEGDVEQKPSEKLAVAQAKLEKLLAKEKQKLGKLGKITDVGDVNKAVELNNDFLLNVTQIGLRLNPVFLALGLDKKLGFDDSVDGQVFQVERANKAIKKTEEDIAAIDKKIIAVKQDIYVDAYTKAKNAYAPVEIVDALLLAMFEDLGKNAPKSLEAEVVSARQRKISDPGTPEFAKRFTAGDYRGALQNLAETNYSTVTVHSSMGASFNDAEIFRLYEKATNPNPDLPYKPLVALQNPLLAGSMESVMADRMRPGSFGALKIAEGYIALAMPDTDTYSKRDNPLGIAEVMIARKQPDGTLSVFFVDANGRASTTRPLEQVINMQSAQKTADRSAEMQRNFSKLMEKLPSFAKLQDAGKDIQSKFVPLQTLFEAGERGKRTKGFVELAQGIAREIQGSNALAILRATMPDVRKDLAILKALPQGYRDQFEKQIQQMEKSLAGMCDLVEGGKIEHFCVQVLNPAFSVDSLGSWATKELIVIVTVIAFAVGTMFVVGSTGGLAIAAAGGTVGGMVGGEVGHVISEKVGEWQFGEGYSNKSTLGKYLAEEKMIDPKTGKLRKIDGIDLVETYGEQFVIGFISTFALMGAGQLAGKWLSRFAARHSATAGFKGDFAALINKIPRLQAQHVDLLSKGGMKNMMKRLSEEYLQELGEEGVEGMAERIGPVTGFLASLYNCLTPGRVRYMLGKQHVAAEVVTSTELGALSVFSFDATQSEDVEAKVRKNFERDGFTVTKNADGSIHCEKEITLKDKTKMKAETIFNPTKESIAMRDLMGSGASMDGKSQLRDLYGVSRVGENKYEVATGSPKGKINIKKYLARQGFAITENTDGSFTAQKGKEPAVEFREKSAQEGGETLDSATARQEKRWQRRIDKAKRETDPNVAAAVQATLGILDTPEGRPALDKSLQDAGILNPGETLTNDEFNAIFAMHKMGGSGNENAVKKSLSAEKYGKEKNYSPNQMARWKKIYEHALEKGFAGTKVHYFTDRHDKAESGPLLSKVLQPLDDSGNAFDSMLSALLASGWDKVSGYQKTAAGREELEDEVNRRLKKIHDPGFQKRVMQAYAEVMGAREAGLAIGTGLEAEIESLNGEFFSESMESMNEKKRREDIHALNGYEGPRTQWMERLLDPNYLPKYAELKAYRENILQYEYYVKGKQVTREEAEKSRSYGRYTTQASAQEEQEMIRFLEQESIFEIFTEEYIDKFGRYLAQRAESLGATAKKPITILEVGAGSGKLSHFLQKKLDEIAPGKVKVIATDNGSWSGIKKPFPVEAINQRDALSKYKPEIVISSWMPPHTDWTASFRAAPSVNEYLLIGWSDDGVTGKKWKTWGFQEDQGDEKLTTTPYAADGFSRVNNPNNVSDVQLSRLFFMDADKQHTDTTSFRRDREINTGKEVEPTKLTPSDVTVGMRVMLPDGQFPGVITEVSDIGFSVHYDGTPSPAEYAWSALGSLVREGAKSPDATPVQTQAAATEA